MIEYITGIFGIFWLIATIVFPFIVYKFIKRNGIAKTVSTIFPICIILYLLHYLASGHVGTTQFDSALTLIKDLWFLGYHVIIIGVLMLADNKLVDNLFSFKRSKQQKNGGKNEIN